MQISSFCLDMDRKHSFARLLSWLSSSYMRLLCHANVYVDIVITGILTPETTKCQPLGKLAMLPNDLL